MERQYIKTQNEIYELICKAYANKFLLKEIGTCDEIIKQNDVKIHNSAYSVVGYLTELIKADFAMTLYKINIDTDKDAKTNNLRKLYKDATSAYPNEHIHKRSISKEHKTIESDVRRVRNSFLAHDEANRESTSISISDLEILLDEYTCIFNELSFSDKNPQAKKVTKDYIDGIHLNMVLGVRQLLGNGISK